MLSVGALDTDIHVVLRTDHCLILQRLPALWMLDFHPASDMWRDPLGGCGFSCIVYESMTREGRDVAAASYQVEGDQPQLKTSSKAAVDCPSGEELTQTPGYT